MGGNKNNMRKIFILLFLFIVFSGSSAYTYCFSYAGEMFGIEPMILISIAKVESNFNHAAISWNKDGTYDYGLMQINSRWYKTLGEEIWNKLSNPCANVCVAAWILKQCIKEHGYNWDAIGCYNSKNKNKRIKYAKKIQKVLSSMVIHK